MNCKIAIFLALIFLTGCGPILNPYQETFKCKAPDADGKCIDTPSAYQDARYPQPESVQPADIDAFKDRDKKNLPTDPAAATQHDIQSARYKVLSDLLEEPKKPLIQPPKILRVLMLPYEGEHGELFMTRYVYLQVEGAKWLLTDQQEKEEER